MSSRSELQTMLEQLLETDKVYYQPPETVKMSYPAIVYKKSNEEFTFADNVVVQRHVKYEVTVIYRDPDNLLPEKMSTLQYCRYVRSLRTANLYHDIYELYY